MAFNNINPFTETYIAGADLTTKQYFFVVASGANVVVAGDGAPAVGVLWNDPFTGRAATVVRGGDPHVRAGAAIAAGALVASGADGRAITAATGDVAVGRAREAAAAAGDLVKINFFQGGNVV